MIPFKTIPTRSINITYPTRTPQQPHQTPPNQDFYSHPSITKLKQKHFLKKSTSKYPQSSHQKQTLQEHNPNAPCYNVHLSRPSRMEVHPSL